jgi:hypothetical protein
VVHLHLVDAQHGASTSMQAGHTVQVRQVMRATGSQPPDGVHISAQRLQSVRVQRQRRRRFVDDVLDVDHLHAVVGLGLGLGWRRGGLGAFPEWSRFRHLAILPPRSLTNAHLLQQCLQRAGYIARLDESDALVQRLHELLLLCQLVAEHHLHEALGRCVRAVQLQPNTMWCPAQLGPLEYIHYTQDQRLDDSRGRGPPAV